MTTETRTETAEKVEKEKEVHSLLNAFDDIYKDRTILIEKVIDYAKKNHKNMGTLFASCGFLLKHEDLVEKKKLFIVCVPVGNDNHLHIVLKEIEKYKKLKIFKTKCPKCTRPDGSLEINVKRNVYFKPDKGEIIAYDSNVYPMDMDKKFIVDCLNAFDGFLKKVCDV